MSLRPVNKSYTAENRYKINNSAVYIKEKTLTKRWIKGFDAAKEAIVKSDGKCQRQMLGAAIFHGNRLLSTGCNTFTKTKPGNISSKQGVEYCITAHAEQEAIEGIKHFEYDNLKLIMYVVRLSSGGLFTNSRPCSMCIDYMRLYGIKKVRFVNELGIPQEMSL
jgi:deoxycytidylate deaminase